MKEVIKDIMMRLVAPGIVGLFERRSLAGGNGGVAGAEEPPANDQNGMQGDMRMEESPRNFNNQ